MRIVSAEELARILDYPDIVEAIRDMFRSGCEMPTRHHHTVKAPDGPDATLLLMPAWRTGQHIGIKIVTIFPGNGDKGLPAVMGNYLLLDGTTGSPVAMLDGQELTVRRTACASALAADYLARTDCHRLLMVGTGAMAPHLIQAHAAVRPITEVSVWGRSPDKALALAKRLDEGRLSVRHAPDLAAAVAEADVISCATLATEPLVRGAWLAPGQHIDLVGAFTPKMRESDDEAIRRSRVFVDTRDGALAEGGDIMQPIQSGALAPGDIQGDLYQLCRNEVPGRGSNDEITLFKSTGAALEDLAAAELAHQKLSDPRHATA